MGAALLAGACGGGDGDAVTILAASSLTDAFEELAERHEGDEALAHGSSGALATQLREGAPGDVFASADDVAIAGFDGAEVFATNRLAILVPEGNPAGIGSVEDLAGVRLALCGPEAPCGRYAAEAFAAAGMDVPPASREENARGVAQKVAAGEADAGIAYVTDAGPGTDVVVVDGIEPTYLIVALTAAGEPFVDLVLSEEGLAVLADHGFGPP